MWHSGLTAYTVCLSKSLFFILIKTGKMIIEIECTCPKCNHNFEIEHEIDETDMISGDINDLD